ncbi:chromatin assembly factor 1 subunit A-B [Cataglyphis hispanica]|uniref:chromatin assembly factor 1 subunit A-B n=1 Tax=Cataglyphis hispanica TaxID=1086592 RepID=UPI0021809B5A|nr:chromatin assembly factor 1 subunit A-B [Cataglyphis hispanica]XP_050452584.1 chromatin assembly factor 1 subunit A-B [Cataglyphis hispanica]
MDISLEDDDCAVEAVTPAKKKKMKQAQLPFQISSASKSPNSTNTMSNKKKRKIISPSVESKNSKLIKLTVKENSVPNICERENIGEEKLNSSDEIEILTLDEEKKNLEQSDQQDGKKMKSDTTSKRTLLGKNKKLDRSQQKSGALTKFLKKIDKETESDCLHELKDKQNQNTFASEEENEICLNESLGTQTTESTLQNLSQENKQLKDTKIVSKDSDHSFCQKSDCDITILSSDNEDLSELDKSTLNEGENEEIINKPATPVTPKTDKIAKKIKLTPKQLEKRQEIARKREEKLRLKKEKDKKREEEKEQKKKERELKELKKQMEIEQKQKEKEAKEEERRKREEAKEEEKRKKEEEKLEAQRKKQKAASNFASFFVPKKQEVKSEEESVIQVKNFMPFEIKADMRIAPICRRMLTKEEKSLLDRKRNLDVQKSELYLEDIKKGRITPHTSSKTWPLETKDDDIVLLDEDDGSSNIISDTRNLEKHRPKLLQFSENRRPPYWGTWRKRSNILNPRRPFAKEKNLFDYEIDSDDEWEEEEPGESLKGSDDEKDEENPEDNEYDVDNEFMVPHGYLSEEEAQADEEEVEDMTPQTQKMKLKILGEQFEAERNTKTYKLKPKIIGCIWQGSDNSFPESVSTKVKEFLTARQAWISNTPIVVLPSISSEEDILAGPECKTPTQQSVRGPKKTKFPDEALPDLIRLLHGNTHGRRFLMKEFITFWSKNGGSQLSKVSVLSKINEVANRIACPEEGPMHLKSCWYISEDIRKQYLPDERLSLPNSWTYILTPSRKSDTQDISIDKAEKEEKEKEQEKKHIPLITQFTKKITQEEMKKQLTKSVQEETKKQLTAKPDQISVPSKLPPLDSQRPPKRATLLSVGRGEQFPEKSRENMLAKFIGLNKRKEEEASSSEKMIADSDDVLFVESIDMKKVDQKNDKS